MIVGTVVGNVWATAKDESLVGLRFLVVQPLDSHGQPKGDAIVAVDPIGAGEGERVLVVFGRAAALRCASTLWRSSCSFFSRFFFLHSLYLQAAYSSTTPTPQ